MLKRVSALLLSATVMAACSDSTTLPSESLQTPPTGRELLAQLTCKVDVAAERLTCAPASASLSSGALGDLIIGGQNTYVKLTSTGFDNNGTTVSANVTVQNLTVQPWATTDGSTVAVEGLRVFFHTLPTSPVTVANADGTDAFTASGQPYHAYTGTMLGADAILTPGETSSAKNWVFNLNGGGSFTFQVYVKAKLPDDLGVLKWTSQTLPANTVTWEQVNTVWGSGANDVWLGGPPGNNAIMRWNGSSWTTQASARDVIQIWGSGAGNVYFVGGDSIRHWNGTTWSGVATGATTTLFSVWGSSASDVYVGGDAGTLVHSTGGAFSAVAGTGIGVEQVAAIWGSSSSDVWVGATNVYHYNGSSWSTVNTGVSNIRAIWGSSGSDIWVGATAGNMAHYASGSWTTTTVGSADIGGIWGTSDTDVYMVNRAGEIWHYNGLGWTSYTPAAGQAFLGIWGSGRTDIWVVGTDFPGFEFKRAYRSSR